LLAIGRPGALAFTYLSTNLGFLFLGARWMSKYAVLLSRHPAWGLLFLLIPTTLISLDRQTVDLAFTALVVGPGYAWRTGRWRLLVVLVGLSSVVRETGLVLAFAFLIGFVHRQEWRRSAALLAGTLPFWLWSPTEDALLLLRVETVYGLNNGPSGVKSVWRSTHLLLRYPVP
jgi:hypothetical protein